jgi:hypothetical protein
MRMGMASALCVVLLSTCFPATDAAQSNPAKPQPLQALSGKPQADARLSARLKEGSQNAELAAAELASKLRDELAQRATGPSLARPQEKAAITPMPCAQCAHILMWKPPSNMDERMIIEVPEDLSGTITTYQAVPPCPKDFRGALMIPQAGTSPFMAPQRMGPFFLDPPKPFHPDHP